MRQVGAEMNDRTIETVRRPPLEQTMLKPLRMARWAFRKLQLPIGRNALVLDVGSGANPHPRADVLLERYATGQHRHGAAAVVDRPTVFADACQMPFRDKAFDYVIAFHVLEHIPRPELFLSELMRVAKAGYIETPNVMFERLVPYDVHCLEIMDLDGRLIIRKKSAPATDQFLSTLKVVPRSARWNAFFYGNPEYFHVRHFWKDTIDFEVVNPEESCEWYMRESSDASADTVESYESGLRGAVTSSIRTYYGLTRKRAVDLRDLLVCPECRGALDEDMDHLVCPACRKRYQGKPCPAFAQELSGR
jgi:SAM-dependent methyltransferase